MTDFSNCEILLDAIAEVAYELAGAACPPAMEHDRPCPLTNAHDVDAFDVAYGDIWMSREEGAPICRRCWADFLAQQEATSGR